MARLTRRYFRPWIDVTEATTRSAATRTPENGGLCPRRAWRAATAGSRRCVVRTPLRHPAGSSRKRSPDRGSRLRGITRPRHQSAGESSIRRFMASLSTYAAFDARHPAAGQHHLTIGPRQRVSAGRCPPHQSGVRRWPVASSVTTTTLKGSIRQADRGCDRGQQRFAMICTTSVNVYAAQRGDANTWSGDTLDERIDGCSSSLRRSSYVIPSLAARTRR